MNLEKPPGKLLLDKANASPPCKGCLLADLCAEAKLTCWQFRHWVSSPVRHYRVNENSSRGIDLRPWAESFHDKDAPVLEVLPPAPEEPEDPEECDVCGYEWQDADQRRCPACLEVRR